MFYGRGNDDGYNKGFIFKNQQILTGSGVDLELESFYIPAYTPGKNPYASNQLNLSSNTILAESIDNIVLQGFNLSSKDSSTISLRDVSAKIMNNVITTQAGQNSLEHLGVRDSTLRLNSFNQPVMIDGSTNSATYYSIINNTFSTSSGNTLTLIDPSLSTLIANNSFYSFAPTGRAVFFSNIMSPNGPTAAIYRNNLITNGFAEGFVHNSDNREATSVTFENNTIVSNLNTAILHYSASQNGTLLCQNNAVKFSKTGIYVVCGSDSNLSCYIEKNYIKSSQNCLELDANSKGNATINDNTLYGDGLGVVISNASDQRNLLSFNIQNNKISTIQYGIDIQNTNNSLGSTYGSITGNSIDDGLGIRLLIDNASGNICSTIVNNRGFGFGRFNATTSPGAGGSIVVKLNPGTFEENNPGFKFVTVSGNVFFVPIQTSCPRYSPIIYVNNTNTQPNPDGSKTNPFPTLKQAESVSVNGGTIYISAGDGTTKGYDQGIVLKNGQSLLAYGSGSPKITSGSSAVITALGDCTISDLQIIPNIGFNGIETAATGTVTIKNNSFIANQTPTDKNTTCILVSCPNISIDNNSFAFDPAGKNYGIAASSASINTLNFDCTKNAFTGNSSYVATIQGNNFNIAGNIFTADSSQQFATSSSASCDFLFENNTSSNCIYSYASYSPSNTTFNWNSNKNSLQIPNVFIANLTVNGGKLKIQNINDNIFGGWGGLVFQAFVNNNGTLCLAETINNNSTTAINVFKISGASGTANCLHSSDYYMNNGWSIESGIMYYFNTPCP